jgi:hypothetical protein
MKLILEAIKLLWPSMVLAAIWLAVGLVGLWYARATRRPIFLWSGLGALLLMLGEVVSPLRVAYNYLKGTPIPGGTVGKIQVLVGAYKYQIAIEALGAIMLLVGIVLEVARARRRARSSAPAPAVNAMASGGLMAGSFQATNAPLLPDMPPAGIGNPGGAPALPVRRQMPSSLSAPPPGQPCPRCGAVLSQDAQVCSICWLQLAPTGPLAPPFEPPTSPPGRTSARSGGFGSPQQLP